MNILMIGDIYGRLGRLAVKRFLPDLITKYNVDLTIANGENTSHGKSITRPHYEELKTLGVNVFTSGNHIFKNPEVYNYIDEVNDLLRPLNFNSYVPGKGTTVVKVKNKTVRITNLIGRSFMEPFANNPYEVFDNLLKSDLSDIHIVDYHAEATAEKLAFAWNYDANLTALVGTHTHVQTADNRLLPQGSAYISDLGMCGCYNSIIGASPDEVIYKEKTGLPIRFQPAEDESLLVFSAVLIKIDEQTNRATTIDRIMLLGSDDISKRTN